MNVEIQNHALVTELADLVSLPIKTGEFFNDITDPGLAIITDKFYRHYETVGDPLTGTQLLRAGSEDDVVYYAEVAIDRTDRTADDVTTRNYQLELVLKNIDGIRENIIESYPVDFSTGQLDNTGETSINFTDVRSFQFPDGDQSKSILVKRRPDLDTGNLRVYEVRYPFLLRWDDFTLSSGLDPEFFDSGELKDGKNHDWNRLNNDFPDWNLNFRLTCNFVKNGNTVPIISERLIDTFAYGDDEDWINEDIAFFSDAVDITPNITAYKDTKVTITKRFIGAGATPLTSQVHWVARVEIWRQGSLVGLRYLSSVRDLIQNSWFKSVDGSNLVVKSLLGDDHTATLLIDKDKLQALNLAEGTQIKVSGRIYDLLNTGETECCLLTEDGDEILTEDGLNCITTEECVEAPSFFGKLTETGNAKLTEGGANKLIE